MPARSTEFRASTAGRRAGDAVSLTTAQAGVPASGAFVKPPSVTPGRGAINFSFVAGWRSHSSACESYRMIPKSGYRFSDKIMHKQKAGP
jgi:hypothetical protein